jgi:transposase
MDAQKLAERLRQGALWAVYPGENGLHTRRELSRSYLTLSQDLTRVMNRVKALYHSWGLAGSGTQVYAPRHRAEWLIKEAGVHRRAEFTYRQLDGLRALRQAVRRNLLAESRKHRATTWLSLIPGMGPLQAALVVALLQIADRFRTKRPLWTYSGLAIKKHGSGEYRYVDGQLRRSPKTVALRGLNKNHNHDLKSILENRCDQGQHGGWTPARVQV